MELTQKTTLSINGNSKLLLRSNLLRVKKIEEGRKFLKKILKKE